MSCPWPTLSSPSPRPEGTRPGKAGTATGKGRGYYASALLFSYSPKCLERLYEKSSNTREPPRHEANHGSVHQRFPARTQPLVIFAHPPVLIDPGDRALDGLLANDKFCMIRHTRLSLSHSRRRPNLMPRQTEEDTDARTYPPAGTTRHGGNDETSVARTQGGAGTTGRPRSLGPSVPVPPAVEPRKPAGGS